MSAIEQLRSHFGQLKPDEQAYGWEAMWQKQVTPWDKALPNPALVDLLNSKSKHLQPGSATRRKRALVPGCGKGYDVLLLASHGYDAWGLDTAPSAIAGANEVKAQNEQDPGQYPVQDKDLGTGSTTFLQANFFKDDWLAETGGQTFDLIYDYTFLCALHPDMRPAWAKRQAELLSADGSLVCLEFPLHKPPSASGPPHGLSSELYVELFKQPGEQVAYDAEGYVTSVEDRQISPSGLQRVQHFKPNRSHAMGQGHDMLSIWQHVKSL